MTLKSTNPVRSTRVFKSFDQLQLEATAREKKASERPTTLASPKKLKRLEDYYKARHAI